MLKEGGNLFQVSSWKRNVVTAITEQFSVATERLLNLLLVLDGLIEIVQQDFTKLVFFELVLGFLPGVVERSKVLLAYEARRHNELVGKGNVATGHESSG